MELTIILAILGWLWAIVQFIINHRENHRRDEEKLLEKTLGYFERGMLARTMAISLVSAIWFKRKKYLDVIVPVLISQATFLFLEAEDCRIEERNLIRLLYLIHKALPYSEDPRLERIEMLELLLSAAIQEPKIDLSKPTLRSWYAEFNDGDTEFFDAETGEA